MKNLLTIVGIFAILVSFGVNSANAGNMDAKAKSAFKQECSYHGAVEVGQTEVISICFVSGFITRVTIIPKVNCNQIDCDVVKIGALGYVDFGCDDEVISVTCY